MIGTPAPDFSLTDQKGNAVSLSDFRGKKAVVVYFYPKDETPGCTAEACAFRDAYEDFRDAGAIVIGISSDSAASHAAFAAKHRLNFTLLSDPREIVRKAYGVSKTLGLLPGRETFVIDVSGLIRLRFSSQFRPRKHILEALEVLRRG
jgi:peroxiredoxin Q/BCP